MTNDEGMTKQLHPSFRGFTLIELLIVMAIIIVLSGLILATAGYVQKKGKRSRAEAEIAAMSAALENYKADNGVYPQANTLNPLTDVNPKITPHPNVYETAAKSLYGYLSGDNENFNNAIDTDQERANKTYFSFKPLMLTLTKNADGTVASVDCLRDPFGNSYGYSTAKSANPAGTAGYNPTFDLWSTADETTAGAEAKWIKNW